jgi:hypothetical protein
VTGGLHAPGLFGLRRDATGDRVRAALWSTYFHRFHNHWSSDSGEVGPPDEIPARYRPLTPNQAMQTLAREARAGGGFPRSVLRGAAAQVMWSQYQLDVEGEKALSDLVAASEDAPASDGFARLRARGDPFQRSRASAEASLVVDDRRQLGLVPAARSDPSCQVNYVEVRSTGTLTVLSYEVVLDRPLEDVAPIVDPRSWAGASPAFLEVRILEPEGDPGPPGRAPWHGRYFEHVVVNWNFVTVSSFEATLKAEVSLDSFEARTDYSLVKERNWQLANDYGFVSARKLEGRPGRTVVTAEKSVTFRSPWMNFMSPAVLSMAAGQWVETLRGFVDRAEPRHPIQN